MNEEAKEVKEQEKKRKRRRNNRRKKRKKKRKYSLNGTKSAQFSCRHMYAKPM